MPLYVVAVPIGNLSDLSPRALTTLSSVDLVACEDTRKAGSLLGSLGIPQIPKLLSYFDHNEKERSLVIIEKMQQEGISVALISDAGTPCLSDPGYRLVKAAHEAGIKVIPIPGACAVTALLSASGLPTDKFSFVGFLPRSKQDLIKEAQSWKSVSQTIVFYESTSRIRASLEEIAAIYPSSFVSIGRELTKTYEELFRARIEDVQKRLADHAHLKGELVGAISIETNQKTPSTMVTWDLRALANQLVTNGLSVSSTADILSTAQELPISKKEIYQMVLDLKKEKENHASE